MGFDDREIVALSGAHSLGRCHKVRSGFDGPWTSNPLKFDAEYFRNLMTKDWVPRDWDGPLQYTDAESHSLTMLPSDLALKEDPAFAVYAEKYAADESLFFEDFKAAFEKLISLGTATAPASTDLDDAAAKVREECMHGSLEHARTAWRPGVDPNSYDSGSRRTALHKTAFWGHSHIVPWLVDDLGAAVDATDSAGDTALHDTALHDAARFGHANVVSELLARGASPNARNAAGKTPGEVAAENGHASALRRFLEK